MASRTSARALPTPTPKIRNVSLTGLPLGLCVCVCVFGCTDLKVSQDVGKLFGCGCGSHYHGEGVVA